MKRKPKNPTISYAFTKGFGSEFEDAITGAIAQITKELNINFKYDKNTGYSVAGIIFHWWPKHSRIGSWQFGGAAAVTEAYQGGTTYIRFDGTKNWHVGLPISVNMNLSIDMAALHELGHALGFKHATDGSIMESSLGNIKLFRALERKIHKKIHKLNLNKESLVEGAKKLSEAVKSLRKERYISPEKLRRRVICYS